MVATWSESDEDSMKKECTNEDANICFMALEEYEDEVNSNSNYNEFQDSYQELYFGLENLGFKMSLLRKKNYCLQNEFNELKEKFENIEKTKISFEKENEESKKKNEWLTFSLQKFSNGQKTFDIILASQKCIFDQKRLGYKSFKNQNYFVKKASSFSPSTICNFCRRRGHISDNCPLRKSPHGIQNSKLFWIPDGT